MQEQEKRSVAPASRSPGMVLAALVFVCAGAALWYFSSDGGTVVCGSLLPAESIVCGLGGDIGIAAACGLVGVICFLLSSRKGAART